MGGGNHNDEILLKDGVAYLPHEYVDESELEAVFLEHVRDIFGPSALLFPGRKVRSKSGVASVPDAFVLDLDRGVWSVVEVELASHPLYEHVIGQVSKFRAGISDPRTRKALVRTFYDAISSSPDMKVEFERRGITEIHKFVFETLEKPPELRIILDDVSDETQEVLASLPLNPEVTELRTYYRDGGVAQDHVHRFRPAFAHMAVRESPTPGATEAGREVEKKTRKKQLASHTGKTIVAFTFLGQRRTAKIWKDLLLGVCETIYNQHRQDFDRVLDLRGRRRAWFSREKSGMREPRPIGRSGVFAETNRSANRLCIVTGKVMELFGYSRDDLMIEEA